MPAITHVTSSNTDTRRPEASLAPRPALVSRRAIDWPQRTALVVALFLAAVTLWLLRSLWVPLILASWFAIVARPAHKWLSARMGGHRRAASLFTLLLVLGCLLPIAITVLSLAGDAIELVRQIATSPDAFQALEQLVAGPNPGGQEASKAFTLDAATVIGMARQHGAGALQTLTKVAGALTTAIIGVIVFIYGFAVFIQHGPAIQNWLAERAPLRRPHFDRLAAAYAETGRGLLLGVGLTALLQGAFMTVGYLLVDIPHALILGLLTAIACILPALGSGIVWVPVAIALAISHRTVDLAVIIGMGCFVGVIDNFVRPMLSRYGRLRLPVFLLFVAMVGGIQWAGTWGLVLGPLIVRLAVEALDVLREELGRARQAPASDALEH